MSLIKFLKQQVSIIKNLSLDISEYKYIHIMFNDKFNKPFVDFLNKNFNPKEQLVLCKRWYNQFPFPEGDNVIEIKTFTGLKFNKNQKIICHSLFDGELVRFLYNHKQLLKEQAFWVIWGGDLYNAKRDKKNDFVRKFLYAYVSCIEGDEIYAKEKYHSSSKLLSASYLSPIVNNNILQKIKNTNLSRNDYITVQINNSCDLSTIEMLDILSKYKDKNIKITTILSYGDLQFKNDIIQKGKAIYGSNFYYLDTMLCPEDYANYLNSIDILVLSQHRQMGVSNACAAAYLGKKVFIRKEITSYNYLSKHGIKVFDTNSIINKNWDEFILYDEQEKLSTMKHSQVLYSEDFYKNEWKNIFEREINNE